jgi:hypothetical protein
MAAYGQYVAGLRGNRLYLAPKAPDNGVYAVVLKA